MFDIYVGFGVGGELWLKILTQQLMDGYKMLYYHQTGSAVLAWETQYHFHLSSNYQIEDKLVSLLKHFLFFWAQRT